MPYQPYAPSREVRLGLVLYGGVSLAIYINGVAREFFRAARGQDVYSLLKGLTDSDIGVDIVSGTSAGGINGIFLGFALCNERDFAGFAGLWRDLGDISKLMRDPSRNPTGTKSLLDSEGYYEPALARAFATLGAVAKNGYEFVTPVEELDLFITGTDVYGDVSTVFDDSGDPVDVKNHRAVFQLKHRKGRKEPFKPAHSGNAKVPDAGNLTFQSLARLARLTSAFPAAFTPVFVASDPMTAETVDGRLQLWGALGRAAWFVDGGVLNNKPFTSTLHEIFYRTADRDVERRLLYVEPAPERFAPNRVEEEPNFFEVIGDSLIGIPGYQSIAGDIQELNDHNSRVQQYNQIARAVSDAHDPAAPPSPEAVAGYTRSRLIRLRDRVLEGILNRNGRRGMFTPGQKHSASALLRAFEAYPIDPAHTLRAFDIYTRLRRLFYLTYVLPPLPGSQRLLPGINYWIGILDIIRQSMEYLIDLADVPWESEPGANAVWTCAGNLFKGLLDPDLFAVFELRLLQRVSAVEPPAEGAVDPAIDFNTAMHARIAELVRAPLNYSPLGLGDWRGMLDSSDRIERLLLGGQGAAQQFASGLYMNFEGLDTWLYPLTVVSGLKGRDVIKLTRVSPLDAQRGFSRREYREKLAGAQFHNFGGFFKRSWRSNDLLWGRLDGLCQLVECVFTRERLEAALATGRPQVWLTGMVTGWELKEEHPLNPANLFAHAGDAAGELADWIERLLDPVRRARALDEFDEKRELLIFAAQFNILREDLGDVAADAIREQMEWNLFKRPAGRDFVAADNVFDPYVTALASGQWAERQIESLTNGPAHGDPEHTPLGKFFRERYAVGEERMGTDIPEPVLLDIYSRGALLARNCILTALGKRGEKLEKSPIYTVFFDAPLRLFHAWVSWWRRSPSNLFYGQMFVAAAALILLAAAWFGRKGIFADAGLVTWAIFVLAPLAVLGAQAWFLLRARPRWKRPLQAGLTLGILVLLLLGAFWVRHIYSAYNQSVSSIVWPGFGRIAWTGAISFAGIPLLLIAVSALAVRKIKRFGGPRRATRAELAVALRAMDDSALLELSPGLAPEPPLDHAALVEQILDSGDLEELEFAIRQKDRDALPNHAPALVKQALEEYFTNDECREIGAAMGFPEDRAASGGRLFNAASRADRLAELERRMRDMHPAIF